MEVQFAALGLSVERLPASYGADPDVRATAEVVFYSALASGEIGVFESHRRCWQKVLDEGWEGCVVFEDDVALASDFGNWDIPADILASADVIKFDQGAGNMGRYGVNAVPVSATRSLVRFLGQEYCTGAYFVTNKGARKLLAQTKRYFDPVDRLMFDPDYICFWQLEIWKLDAAAAVQSQHFNPENGEEAPVDSITYQRIHTPGAIPTMTPFKQTALRFRRLRDWDFRRAREARSARNLSEFEKSEQTEVREIPFFTPDASHIEKALELLNTP